MSGGRDRGPLATLCFFSLVLEMTPRDSCTSRSRIPWKPRYSPLSATSAISSVRGSLIGAWSGLGKPWTVSYRPWRVVAPSASRLWLDCCVPPGPWEGVGQPWCAHPWHTQLLAGCWVLGGRAESCCSPAFSLVSGWEGRKNRPSALPAMTGMCSSGPLSAVHGGKQL